MAKFRTIKNSLIGGEVSATADGRTDLAVYPHSCKIMRNMIPFTAGGAYMRPGTIYQGSEDFVDYAAPLVYGFVASNSVEYAVVVYPPRSGGTQADIKIYEAQQGSPAEVFAASDIVDTLTLNPDPCWTREDFEDCNTLQLGDVLYFVTPDKVPFQIVMTAPDTFSLLLGPGYGLSGAELRDSMPYKAQNTTPTTLTAGGTTLGFTYTITMSNLVFGVNDIGSYIKVHSAGVYGLIQITSAPTQTVPQTFDGLIVVALGAAGPVTTWWESAWSGEKGYPGTIEFYRNRLAYGGNADLPDSIWWSEQNDFDQLSVDSILDPDSTPAGSQPFTFTLAAGRRSRIKWMKAAKQLLIGTEQSEWLLDKETTSSIFGCDNASALRQSEYGSNGVIAYTGSEIFFVSLDGSVVRSLAFDYYNQAYTADEVQTLYTEFPGKPPLDYYMSSQCAREILQVVWDETRNTLWCLDNAGNLRGLTRVKKANISLWHSHELGGYDADNRPDIADVDAEHPISQLVCEGAIVWMASVLDTYTNKTNLWFAVRREIDGTWVWTIETMRGGYVHSDSAYSQIIASQMLFTDCSKVIKATGVPSTYTVAHLEGEAVRATANSLGNGIFALPAGTVDTAVVQDTDMGWSGLPNYPGPTDGEYWLAFGLPYVSVIQPMRLEAGSVVGSAQGAMKHIHKVFVRFYKTMLAKVGPDEDRLQTQTFRLGSTPTGKSAELFTGDREVLLESDFDRDGFVWIQQDEPLPFGVTSLVAEGQTYD